MTVLADLLACPGVVEEAGLGTSMGVLAYHGGSLERVTDVVAREVADRTGASYYAVVQPEGLEHHIPSTAIDPRDSVALRAVLDRVDTVVTIHGYGRRHLVRTILVGGRNRALAAHVGDRLRAGLPDFDVVDDLQVIPAGLRGLHARNPVNLPANAGVQLELPPGLRWHLDQWGWSDTGGIGRAPQVDALIEVLAHALDTWPG